MTYEETCDLCRTHGINVDCWSPLELSMPEMPEGCVATGELAEIVIEYLKKEHGIEDRY